MIICVLYLHGCGCMLSQIVECSNIQIILSAFPPFFSACFFLCVLDCPTSPSPILGKEKHFLEPSRVRKLRKARGRGATTVNGFTVRLQNVRFFSFGANHWQHQMMCTIGFDGINRDIRHKENEWNIKTSTIYQRGLNMDSLQALATLHGVAETSFPDTDLNSRLPVSKGVAKCSQGVAMVASSKCKQETYSEEYNIASS